MIKNKFLQFLLYKRTQEYLFKNPFFRLIDETKVFMQKKTKMQKKLEKYSKFQKYLDRVLEVAEEVTIIQHLAILSLRIHIFMV